MNSELSYTAMCRTSKCYWIIAAFAFFFLFAFIPKVVFAASTSLETQEVQKPEVIFAKGLLSVQANNLALKTIMEAVSQ